MNLEEISKNSGIALYELTKVKTDLEKKYERVLKLLSKEQVDGYINTGIQQYIDRFQNLGLEQFFGVILTASQPKDGMSKRRKDAVKSYIENPDVAINAGVIQEVKENNGVIVMKTLSRGMVITKTIKEVPKSAVYLPDQKVHIVPLDNRESWPNGKKNFGYLNALPSEQFFTNISGLVWFGDGSSKPFKMTYNCNENDMVPLGVSIKFYAKVKENLPTHITLNFNKKYTKFEQTGQAITDEQNAAIMNFYDITPISEVETAFNERDSNYDIISIMGMVQRVWVKEPTEDKPHPWATVIIGDSTSTIKVLLHPGIDIVGLDEGSFVKIWGSPNQGKRWDTITGKPGDEIEYSIFGIGLYVLSGSNAEAIKTQNDEWEQ